MTKTNNITKNLKVKKYNDYNSREEKTAKLEARKQASRDKKWARVDREDWRY